ncbi:hypothetical protein [Amycolatopsis silviterrae]|uniref:SRPBCC family protein n=1 Tax=Amycolatopsis silviterrae TaxID=1656914 RepID=A0ABW5HJ65_9PSEU
MTEFEAGRRMPATAEHVYAVAGDVAHRNDWLPDPGAAEPAAHRDRLRLEWHGRGWLQVEPADAGTSHATLHLSFPDGHDGPERVRTALDRLAVLSGSPG